MSMKTKTNGTGAVGTGASPDSGCYLLRHKTQKLSLSGSKSASSQRFGRGRIVKDVVIRWFGRSFAISIGSPVLWIKTCALPADD